MVEIFATDFGNMEASPETVAYMDRFAPNRGKGRKSAKRELEREVMRRVERAANVVAAIHYCATGDVPDMF